MGLADEVLALHDAIRDVLIVENRAGDMHVIDQAGRIDYAFSEAMDGAGKDVIIAPTMILGAASQVGRVRKSGQLKLVGMLYAQLGAIFAPLDDNSYVMVTTSNENLPEIMKVIQEELPNVIRRRYPAEEVPAIQSAVDVDEVVRSFFARTRISEPNQVQMDHAALNGNGHSWQVSGSYRPPHAIRSKRYRMELDARNGAVTKFEAAE